MSCVACESLFDFEVRLSSTTCSDCPTWESLINNALPVHERISLIAMIFSDPNQLRIVKHLSGNNAQTFIDEIDKASTRIVSHSNDKLTGCIRSSTMY